MCTCTRICPPSNGRTQRQFYNNIEEVAAFECLCLRLWVAESIKYQNQTNWFSNALNWITSSRWCTCTPRSSTHLYVWANLNVWFFCRVSLTFHIGGIKVIVVCLVWGGSSSIFFFFSRKTYPYIFLNVNVSRSPLPQNEQTRNIRFNVTHT